MKVRRFARALGWSVAGTVCFILAVASGAIFASACFFESRPTARILLEHFFVMLISIVLSVAAFIGAGKCAERAIDG